MCPGCDLNHHHQNYEMHCLQDFCLFLCTRDRGRTTVNVLGDAMGTGIVNHLSRDDLKEHAKPAEYEAIPLDQRR